MIYEFQHIGISEYFRKESGNNFCFPNHLHKAFELITVTAGEMEVEVDDKIYIVKPHNGILIFPNQIHSLKSTQSNHTLFIFSTDIVKAYYTKYANMIPTTNEFQFNDFYLKQLESLNEISPTYLKKGIFYSICSEFDSQTNYTPKKSDENDLLFKIFDFVEKNYANDCSLYNLSKFTSYSYSYLSKYFKEIVKMSFNEYVNRHRISNSCYLLDNTDSPILQCAIESGYDSLRSFNRNFKQITGITPQQYRNK